MKRETYKTVEKVMIGGREVTVTHIRPILTPEELIAAQISTKKKLNYILREIYKQNNA